MGMVPSTSEVTASMTVAFLPRPLKVKTRLVAGSKRMASGFSPVVFTLPVTSNVESLKTVTVFACPLLVQPRSSSREKATP